MTTPEEELEYSENICHSCQKICKHGDPLLIKALGNVYHQECFKCDFCQVSVIEKFYLLELDNNLIHHQHNIILCEKDYYKHSRFKCRQCHEDIKNDNFQVIGTYRYHQHCLHCPGCTVLKTLPIHVKTGREELPIKEYFDYNGRPYCRYHYSLIKGTECFGCGQAILQSELNQKWHLECYKIKKILLSHFTNPHTKMKSN
ncbi:uncharacterized protein BX663DRAFT_96972 [Cokeromyces recurvatus]|uniref:uncharacterized protein n=1 Tax=Cokeromyces recurvatus TaxID=90255 RepID=UPI00222084DA|nr:uncharacterized protein BX663DRAFT_96972 [Cokeromyces recurvatus]KAI7901553.1 hypothetical protein BX663DRAFT_96972 [Cokeromyces recurvatus]